MFLSVFSFGDNYFLATTWCPLIRRLAKFGCSPPPPPIKRQNVALALSHRLPTCIPHPCHFYPWHLYVGPPPHENPGSAHVNHIEDDVIWCVHCIILTTACKSHDHDHQWADYVMTDYLKTKGNVNIKLWDLCEILIVYILLSTFQSVHMVVTVNKPDVRRFIAWIESADWNPWTSLSMQSWPWK